MIARPHRRARQAALSVLLPVLLTACAGDPEPSAAPAAPATAEASATPLPELSVTASAAPTTTQGQAADEESAAAVSLTVVDGEVTGDTGRARVPLGERVRITVTADVADEIHVHGYDLHQDTLPGQAASLEFVADRPGVFEVELEESRVLLTRLQVQ